ELAGWTAALTIGSLVAGVILLAAFAFAESRVSHPLLPLRVIMDRTRGGAYVSVGLSGIAVFGVFLFLTYYLQQVKGYSPVASVLPALLALGLGFGMIFSPAINTATSGVARKDSGVASALVNTMQQVGGSIGTAALSTVALTATAAYLTAHHVGRLAPATAAVHGFSVAFAVSASLFGLG